MSERSFSIRFWGVRGSYPMPGETTVHYGGNTPCVEVRVNGYTIILDAGTGIIPLGRELMRRARTSGSPVEAVLLFSHLHHDHTQGFPFFAPAFLPTTRLHIFGPDFLASSPKVTLDTVMNPPYFPIRLAELNAWLGFATVRETDVILIGESVGGVALFSAGDTIPAADPDLSACRLDQHLRAGDDEGLVPCRDGGGCHVLQPLALVEVEHGKALQESDLSGLAIRSGRDIIAILGREPIRIANRRALLALADIAAHRLRLSVGQPALRAIALLEQPVPQDQDIDPRIAPSRSGIARQAQRRLAIIPWPHPWQDAFLDLRDDPVDHLAVEGSACARGLGLISHVLPPSRIAPAAGVAGVGGRSEPAGPPT